MNRHLHTNPHYPKIKMRNFTPERKDIKGLIVAPTPNSSQYVDKKVIVGCYLDYIKDSKQFFHKGNRVFPSALFGPENRDKIYLKRLMNVEYVPIEDISKYELFGCPIMKASKSGTPGVKCTLSVRKCEDHGMQNELTAEKLTDIIYQHGFVKNMTWDNSKVTLIEAEYYKERHTKKGDGYNVNIHEMLMNKGIDQDEFLKSSCPFKLNVLKRELNKCLNEVIQQQNELMLLSVYLTKFNDKLCKHSETLDKKKKEEPKNIKTD